MQNKKDITKQYLRCIKECFPIYGKREKYYVKQLETHINEFLDFNPNTSQEELFARFGSPTTIVSDYFSELDENYLFQNLKKKRYWGYIAKLITLLSLLLFFWCAFLVYLDYSDSQDQHIAYETTTIIEE